MLGRCAVQTTMTNRLTLHSLDKRLRTRADMRTALLFIFYIIAVQRTLHFRRCGPARREIASARVAWDLIAFIPGCVQ